MHWFIFNYYCDYLKADDMITIGWGRFSASLFLIPPMFLLNYILYKIIDSTSFLYKLNMIDKSEFKEQVNYHALLLLEDTKKVKLYTDAQINRAAEDVDTVVSLRESKVMQSNKKSNKSSFFENNSSHKCSKKLNAFKQHNTEHAIKIDDNFVEQISERESESLPSNHSELEIDDPRRERNQSKIKGVILTQNPIKTKINLKRQRKQSSMLMKFGMGDDSMLEKELHEKLENQMNCCKNDYSVDSDNGDEDMEDDYVSHSQNEEVSIELEISMKHKNKHLNPPTTKALRKSKEIISQNNNRILALIKNLEECDIL